MGHWMFYIKRRMPNLAIPTLLGLGLLLLWAASGCGDEPKDSSPTAQIVGQQPAVSATEAVPPCAGKGESNDACEPRDVSRFDVSRSNRFSTRQAGAANLDEESNPTVEEIMEEGLRLTGSSPVHIALRGTPKDGSVRCELRGVARTAEQRERAIRFWLELGDDEELPTASEVERRFMEELDKISIAYPESAKANFATLARGGITTDYRFLSCYVDYDAHEYLLGTGPAAITVSYDHMADVRSYELYSLGHAAGEYGDEPLMAEGEYQAALQEAVAEVESLLTDILEDRESVVFLAPMGAHGAIAIEAWQVIAQWDLQIDDNDVVHAVRYGTLEGDPEHTQTLTNLKSRVTTAAAGDAFAGKRITNVSGVTQYYKDIGAYDDITPDDGSSDTFTPAQPPPPLECASGTAVADPDADRVLVHDCETLLSVMDALTGTATLNWSADTAMSGWDGVATGGEPSRVTSITLSGKNLSGSVPPELGGLHGLTTLNLGNNQLSGVIPSDLGKLMNLSTLELGTNKLSGNIPERLEDLKNLSRLRLAGGNAFTGCIPQGLKDIVDHDLADTGLTYCVPPDIRTAYFYPTSDTLSTGFVIRSGPCGLTFWGCLGETEPSIQRTNVFLANGGSLRLGFTVGSGDIPGTVTGVRFEVRIAAHSKNLETVTFQPGEYGYTFYSGSDVVAEIDGQYQLNSYDGWTDQTISGDAITAGLSDSLNDAKIQINGPASTDMLKITRLRMVVEYDAAKPSQ